MQTLYKIAAVISAIMLALVMWGLSLDPKPEGFEGFWLACFWGAALVLSMKGIEFNQEEKEHEQ